MRGGGTQARTGVTMRASYLGLVAASFAGASVLCTGGCGRNAADATQVGGSAASGAGASGGVGGARDEAGSGSEAGSTPAAGNGGRAAGGSDTGKGGTAGTAAMQGGSATSESGAPSTAGEAGSAGSSTCDAIPCPQLGTCTAEQHGATCSRTCSLTATYSIATNDDAAALARLQCSVIDGSVDIGGSGVSSLAGLETIREITGALRVLNTTKLANLGGLSRLETVRDLQFQRAGLASIGLTALSKVSGQVDLEVLASLSSIDLSSLRSVGGALSITFCPLLPELHLDKLQSVGELLNVSSNDALGTVNQLPALKSVGKLQFTSDPKLPQCEVSAIATRLGASCSCGGLDTNTTCK